MSWLSRLLGKRSEPTTEPPLCSWIMARMQQGPMSPDEVVRHVDNCPICGPTMAKRKAQQASTDVRVDPSEFPTVMVITVQGPLHLDQIVFEVRRADREVVVMGNRSPAFADPNVLLAEAPKFRREPNLALIFEKHPNRKDPLCLDPMVMIRRSFLLAAAPNLDARSLGEAAIRLAMAASTKGLGVSYI